MTLILSNAKLAAESLFFCMYWTHLETFHRELRSKQHSRGYIIDHLTKNFSAHSDTVVLYYFFDYSEKASLKASTFLRSILHQVIKLEHLLPEFQRQLESLFEDRIGDSEPLVSELEQLFVQFYGKFKRAFLVIDGLDEMGEVEQRNVKSFLRTVQKTDGSRVLAMTHAAMDMSKVLHGCQTLHIKPKYVEGDIATFIQAQIDRFSQSGLCDCSPAALDLIKRKLVCDAEGM